MNDNERTFPDPEISLPLSNKHALLILTLIILTSVSFYIRIIPILHLGNASSLTLLAADDPYYNLHLIELMVTHGQYQWFDPLTFLPYGLWINWGPMFTSLCAGACYMFGATTSEQIAYYSMFIPPLLAALCVPVIYLLGNTVKDWKTGIIAAVFIAFVSGQFFNRSVAGYLDHHAAEVFFSLLFILCYTWAVKNRDKTLIQTARYLLPGIPPILAGVSFFLLISTMPISILFALGVFVFTVVWMLWQHDKMLAYLNAITFVLATVCYIAFIPWTVAINLDTYSFVHILAYLGTALVGLIFVWKDGKYWWVFALAGVAGLMIVSPVREFVISTALQFFGQTQYTNTVQEARGWSWDGAIGIFNVLIPLTAAAVPVFIYRIWKTRRAELAFVLAWVLLITISTIQHIRYEYYFAAVGAVAGAYLLSSLFDLAPNLNTTAVTKKQKKKNKQVPERSDGTVRTVRNYHVAATLITLLCVCSFVAVSAPQDYYFSSNVVMGAPNDWVEPLVWMKTNTPDIGMEFDKVYTIDEPLQYPQVPREYPDSVYGVASWWDYGHIIQYYAERPPNANPFQAGVRGDYGVAKFFTSDTEEDVLAIADVIKTRYVITDMDMATGKMWAMLTWADLDPSEYQTTLYFDGKPQAMFTEKYYNTLVTRLHMFDGSYRDTDHVIYIEYSDTTRQVIRAGIVNSSEEAEALAEEGGKQKFVSTLIAGDGPLSPTGELKALKHFRLIRESSTQIDESNTLRYVKVFEIVPGAVIDGDGIIATQVTTNTGRKFWYGQKSENGTWTLPYPGTYITNMNQTVTVTEEMVYGKENR